MKKKLLLLTILSSTYIVFQSSMNGVTTAQLADRTNSPLTVGNCSACHSGGSFESNMTIELIDKNNQTVTLYEPGEEYTVRYTINATGATKYGLQSTILAADTSNAGTITAKSSNTKTTALKGRTYVDHKTSSNENVFEVTWKAPTENIGEVKIYSSGLAANGNNGTSGDKPININPVTVGPAVLSTLQNQISIKTYPNPVVDKLKIESAFTPQSILLYNLKGQLMLENYNSNEINTMALQSGIYIVEFRIKDQKYQQKIVKN